VTLNNVKQHNCVAGNDAI